MWSSYMVLIYFFPIALIILIVKIIERIREAKKEDKDKYKDY